MKLNIAVTGSEGLLGKALVKKLKENHNVFAGTHFNCDITNFKQVNKAFDKIDVVVHCAVRLDENAEDIFKINVAGTHNVALACKLNNVKQLIHISSVGVYGVAYGVNSEETVPRPNNAYEVTKLKAEKQCLKYKKDFGVTILRSAWIYRESELFDLVRKLYLFTANTWRFLRYGMAKRQLIKLNDLVNIIDFFIGNKASYGEIYNVVEKMASFNNKIYVADKLNKFVGCKINS